MSAPASTAPLCACDVFKTAKRGLKFRTSVNCSPHGKEFAEGIMAELETLFGFFKFSLGTLRKLRKLADTEFEQWDKDTFITLTLRKAIRTEEMLDDICALFQRGHGKLEILKDTREKKKKKRK